MSTFSSRDFSKATFKKLAKRGIEIVGTQAVPNGDSWINAEWAYLVSDNGQGRVWTFTQVLAAAK